MRFHAWLHLSGFLDEPLLALGAGDGDFTFAAGDTHHLTALGAIKVAMLPILQAIKKLQEFAVFLIALIGIAGEAAVERPDHQAIGHCRQHQIDLRIVEKATDQAHRKATAEDHHVQFVGSIAAHHEIAESIGELL